MKSNQVKIQVSEKAYQSVERMLRVANEGYLGGRVGKVDLVSWALIEFEKTTFEKSIEDIRKQSFNQVHYLESVLKLLKQNQKNGETIPDLGLALNLEGLSESIKLPRTGLTE